MAADDPEPTLSQRTCAAGLASIPDDNVANHQQQKAERRRSGAFCCPSAFALLGRALGLLARSCLPCSVGCLAHGVFVSVTR